MNLGTTNRLTIVSKNDRMINTTMLVFLRFDFNWKPASPDMNCGWSGKEVSLVWICHGLNSHMDWIVGRQALQLSPPRDEKYDFS